MPETPTPRQIGYTCSACARVFKSVSAFDKHRTGALNGGIGKACSRRCMTTDELAVIPSRMNGTGVVVTLSRLYVHGMLEAVSKPRDRARLIASLLAEG